MVSDMEEVLWVLDLIVLILVLMEYGLWRGTGVRRLLLLCLNPCSNGIWSLTPRWPLRQGRCRVLILVLMEYGLWPILFVQKYKLKNVLILVLMEYGLWPEVFLPFSSVTYVLILVLMEYGLWLKCFDAIFNGICVLILVLMEYGLWLMPEDVLACTSKS